MARPIWITKSQTISTINEAEYYQFQLIADNAVNYIKIAGEFPRGLQITRDGVIQGIPGVVDGAEEKIYSFSFTVRAISEDNLISDRTFSIEVTNIKVPVIIGPDSDLGVYNEGDYVDIQLVYSDFSAGESISFGLVSGSLPNDNIDPSDNIYPYTLKLSSSGKLSGYILKQPQPFQTYNFVVEISDGISSTRRGFSISTTQSSIVPTPPLLLTLPSEIVPAKHDNFYSFQFIGYDFDGDELEFYIDNKISDSSISGERGYDSTGFDRFGFDQIIPSISNNLTMDPLTGWLYGQLPEIQGVESFTFAVGVRKTQNPFTSSKTRIYILSIFSAADQKVIWLTDSDLGEIFNGQISELSVSAVNSVDSTLPVFYRLKVYDPQNPSPINLPQGLILKDNGLLIGRPSFRYFSLDNGTTRFDNNITFFDETYRFTVEAVDNNGNLLGTRIFFVRVVSRNLKPYENIYLKSMVDPLTRSRYYDLIQSQDWVLDANVYRPLDPYFGRVNELQSLFLPGIESILLTEYIRGTELNHYRKKIDLTNLKLARALDQNFNVVYEVVYAEVNDDLEINNQSVALEIDLFNKLANFYQIDGIDQKKLYPNSFRNMRQRLLEKLQLENKGVLPRWMTSVQEDGGVLGFVRAVPVVYCNPGTGKITLQSLQNKLSSSTDSGYINEFNFEVDRYHVDQFLSRYYDSVSGEFLTGTETTFDRFLTSGAFLNFGGVIDYAVDVPFESINNANLLQLIGSENPRVVSPESYNVSFNGNFDNSVPPWSSWMNSHAVWADTGISSLVNSTWSIERDFGVPQAGIYQMSIMNTDSVVVTVNGSLATEINGFNITDNFNNYTVDIYLIAGRNTIKTDMTISSVGNPFWLFNPKGLSIVIYRTIEVDGLPVVQTVFDTRQYTDPKIAFDSLTFRPGIDGEVDIRSGQTLIFRTQDYYIDYPGLEFENHGWNNYVELYGVDYDSTGFNQYSVIPGLGQPVNQRAGVWTINIDSDFIVTLTFDRAVTGGTYFRIRKGETYAGRSLRLNVFPESGKTELGYFLINNELTASQTRFDGSSTRFLEFRDLYLDPDRSDKYVIYPKLGVFK